MRTSPTQLPSYKELKNLLASEAQRKIPKEKETQHYSDFTVIVELLESFNLSTVFFTENTKFEDMDNQAFFDQTVTMFNDLIDAVLNTPNDPRRQELLDSLYDYLSEEDGIEKSDLIFVFGSKATFRTEKAISLYKKGYAPKILISGKGPFYEKDKEIAPEAEMLGKFAIEHGVAEKDLILEKESISVPDNVKRSLNLLEKEGVPHKSIILVNSPFSQRRGWGHFNKMSKVGTKLLRANVDKVSDKFSREGWYKNEIGVKIVIKEFFGLRVSEFVNTS